MCCAPWFLAQGTCARDDNQYGSVFCQTNNDCQYPPTSTNGVPGSEGCPSPQQTAVYIDTDLDGKVVHMRSSRVLRSDA